MVPNGDEASTSHNVFKELLEDAYFDATNVAEALRDADWISAMLEELDQFAKLKDFTVFQMDVKTAFLNGIIKEEVYVGQPPAESEYVAISGCCAQVLWMRTQLTDASFMTKYQYTVIQRVQLQSHAIRYSTLVQSTLM
nr:putative polyprotein [Tanacetum cinerariifolium]